MNNSSLLSDIWNKFNTLIVIYIVVITLTAFFSIFMAWTMWSENVLLHSQQKLLTQELDSYKLNALYKDTKPAQSHFSNESVAITDTKKVDNPDTKKMNNSIDEKPQIQNKSLKTENKAQSQQKSIKQESQKTESVQNKIEQKQDIAQPTLPTANLYISQHKESIEMLLYGRHFLSADGYLFPKDSRYVITFKGECNVKLPQIDVSQLQIKSISTGNDANNNTTITLDFYKTPQNHTLRHITPHTMEIILK